MNFLSPTYKFNNEDIMYQNWEPYTQYASPKLEFTHEDLKRIALQDYLWELENFTLDTSLPQNPEILQSGVEESRDHFNTSIGKLPTEYDDFLNFLHSTPNFEDAIPSFPEAGIQESSSKKVCFKEPIEEIRYIPNRFEIFEDSVVSNETVADHESKKRGRPLGSVKSVIKKQAVVPIQSVKTPDSEQSEKQQKVKLVKRKIYTSYVFNQDPKEYFDKIPKIERNGTMFYNIQQSIKPVSSCTNMSRVAKKYHSRDPDMFIKLDTSNKKLNFITTLEGLKIILNKLTRVKNFTDKQINYINFILEM